MKSYCLQRSGDITMESFLTPSICHEVSAHGGGVEIDANCCRGGESVPGQCGSIHVGTSQISAVKVGMRNRRFGKTTSAGIGLDKPGETDGCIVKQTATQPGTAQIRSMHRAIAEISGVSHRVEHHGPIQHCTWQLGRGEPRSLHSGIRQMCSAEISSRHLRAIEQRTREIAVGHLSLCQIRKVEIGPYGDDVGQDGVAQLGAVESCVGQVGAGQVDTAKIGLLEICAAQVASDAGRQNSAAQILHRIRIGEQG